MFEVKNLSKKLGNFEIGEISFTLEAGEYFVLLGPSGAGKTVLLESIAGITAPDTGSVFLDNKEITNMATQKRSVGILFQDQALFPHKTVLENIRYGLKCHQMEKMEIEKISNRRAVEYGITDLLNRYPSTLSGGEKQRVALARIMVTNPKVLLLDEPLSALDSGSKREIRKLLSKITEKNIIVIHVTHDYEEAAMLATKLGIMEENTIKQIGSVDEIFHHPSSNFVADFIGIKNFYTGLIIEQNKTSAIFKTADILFTISTDCSEKTGSIIINSEDITLSKKPLDTSARNGFEGKVTGIYPAKLGKEVILDIGLELAAIVTQESIKTLDIKVGKSLFATIKATAIKYNSN